MAGKKTGFLTEPRRDYLNMPEAGRDKKYSETQKSQFDAAISEQANLAIEDLVLIARTYTREDLKSVFPPGALVDLLDALMDRIGMEEVAGHERYYEILLKAIEHRIHEKYRDEGRFFKLESSDYPIMPSKPAYKDLRAYTRK